MHLEWPCALTKNQDFLMISCVPRWKESASHPLYSYQEECSKVLRTCGKVSSATLPKYIPYLGGHQAPSQSDREILRKSTKTCPWSQKCSGPRPCPGPQHWYLQLAVNSQPGYRQGPRRSSFFEKIDIFRKITFSILLNAGQTFPCHEFYKK